MATVRMATRTDLSALLLLVAEYWRFERLPGFSPEGIAVQLERLLGEPRLGCGWLAFDADGGAVGYLLAVYVFSLEHFGLTAEIDEFYVMPGHRRTGIGRELLRVAEAEFVRAGCSNVSLRLSRDNGHARSFYLGHSYVPRVRYELLDKTLLEG